MTMNKLPGPVLRSKDACNPQSQLDHVRISPNSGLVPLDLDDVGEVRGHLLRYALEANGFTVPVVRGGAIHGLGGLLPSTYGRAKGVSEAYVF